MYCCNLQRITAIIGKQITWEKIQVPRRMTRHFGPDPPTTYRDPNISPVQDGGFASRPAQANGTAQTKETAVNLPLRSRDPDNFSFCRELESGVSDLSGKSSSGGDDKKDYCLSEPKVSR